MYAQSGPRNPAHSRGERSLARAVAPKLGLALELALLQYLRQARQNWGKRIRVVCTMKRKWKERRHVGYRTASRQSKKLRNNCPNYHCLSYQLKRNCERLQTQSTIPLFPSRSVLTHALSSAAAACPRQLAVSAPCGACLQQLRAQRLRGARERHVLLLRRAQVLRRALRGLGEGGRAAALREGRFLPGRPQRKAFCITALVRVPSYKGALI